MSEILWELLKLLVVVLLPAGIVFFAWCISEFIKDSGRQ